MKIKAIIVSALILCCISAVIMYTNAAQPKNESKMITEAIQGKNTPQLIKALISRMKEQLDVNDDDFPKLIKEVENYAAECKEPASTTAGRLISGPTWPDTFPKISANGLQTFSRIR